MFLELFNRLKEISSFIYMTTLELNEQLKNKLKIISYGAALASNPANIKEFFALNREKNKRYKLRQSFID